MEQKRTGLSYVFTLAKEERGKLSLGMLLAVFSSALSFVPYLVVYQILLLIIKQEVTLPAMLGWAGIGIAAAVLQAILTSFAGICSHTAAFNTMHRIKVRVLEHMSKFNLGFFQEHAPGQIKTTLFDDVDRIETFLAHSTLELAQAIVVPLMMFIFMLRLNWIMALIMLVPMILGIAIPMALMGRYPDLTDEFAGDTEKLNASANEFITAMPVIKMYHLTAEKFEQYRNSLKIYTDCWIKMCESSCNPLSIALVVLDSAILFTLPVGGWLYLRDSLSAASYLLFILLTMCFFTSFLNMVTIAMGCLILVGTFFINWKLALAECVVILIALPVLNWGNRLVEKYGTIKRDLTSKMISIVLEYIKGMKVFKSANMTSTHFTRMSDTLEDIRKTSVQAEVKTAAPTSMYSIIANFLLPFVLLVGSYLFLGGTIASELLVAFMLMSLALSALLIAFEHSYNLLKELKLATSNLEQAFDTKPLSYKEEKVKLSHFDITFENVNFSYNQQADVLHNISFHAPEGSTTALIGPSGSGKSTVANLIARFWDVTKGCVRIGGQDIRELNPDGLLHYISEVFQENTLLSDTIYNNIKAGREDATEQEVIAAAKAAHCHEFIERLPNGYQTHLAEGGNTLSGGEKQRIAIARAILKDAPILLLDESTASLDADNEAKINQALDRLMKGKTVFVIAHRLNTIQNADQIIVLNQGRIEETGTHEELLRKKGHYYEMVQEQQKAREWIVKGA